MCLEMKRKTLVHVTTEYSTAMFSDCLVPAAGPLPRAPGSALWHDLPSDRQASGDRQNSKGGHPASPADRILGSRNT